MTRRAQLRWLIGAIVLIALVLCAGFVLVPTLFPPPAQSDVVVMDDLEPKNVVVYAPEAPQGMTVQPVPLAADIPEKHLEQWEQAHDRADWVGGAIVTCDLGAMAGTASNAFMEMDRGMDPSGGVDVLSRMWSPIVDNRVTFVVNQPEGEARVLLADVGGPDRDDPDTEPGPPNKLDTNPVRIAWTGATEGKTVGCSSAYPSEAATLRVRVQDTTGQAFMGMDNTSPEVRNAIVVRGCGVMLPLFAEVLEFKAEAGKCAIQAERRNPNFPLIVSRGKTYVVNLQPGETRDITLVAPDEPPLYQPPDLVEISTAADIAAYFGADAAADALESLVSKLASGEWDAQMVQDIMQGLAAGRGANVEFTEEEAAEFRRELEATDVSDADIQRIIDENGIEISEDGLIIGENGERIDLNEVTARGVGAAVKDNN